MNATRPSPRPAHPPLRRAALALLILLPAGNPLTAATDPAGWNQFRGPGGAGVAIGSRPPTHPHTTNLAWKVSLPPGLSSPVLASNRMFLTAVETGRLVTIALDAATGRRLWTRPTPEVPAEKIHPANSPATPSVLVDDGRVHVYFGAYGLLCYDTDGRELWRRPVPTPKSLYGSATSPISHGDLLILVLDNDANLPDSKLSQSRLLALRKSTGETAWETPRPLVRSGWSTPAIWTHAGGDELVVLGSGRFSGYDARTGAEKWFTTGFSRETIALPVAGRGLVYAAAAMLGGVADEQPDPEPFWQAMLRFDTNGDRRVARTEINRHFTFPLRPELPVDHPGFGLPLPDDAAGRTRRQNDIFAATDKDKDGFWTRDEFIANLSFRRGKPMLMAVRPGGRGDVTESHVAWQLNRSIPEIPSPLFHEDRLYMVRNGGILTCVNAINGRVVYDERLGTTGQYSASPVVANGHLFLVSNEGRISIVRTGDTFQPVHSHALGDPAFVTPAFDASTVYFRTPNHLWAFRNRP